MAGLFNSLFGGAAGNVNGGTSQPSAFMSPPNMTPQQFAMLLAMQSMRQNGQGGANPNGPQLPQPGQNPGAAGAILRPQQNMQGLNNGGGMSLPQLLQLAQLIRGRGFTNNQFANGSANPQPQSVSG